MNIYEDTQNSNIFFRCVEDSRDAIMITDINGKMVYTNPAWSQTYQFSREEALGQTPRLLHSSQQDSTFYEEMWKSIRNPQVGSWKGELVNQSKFGKLIPVLLTITPFRNSSGEIQGYMGIAVDLREKKELELKLLHNDRLASIGTLASGLAHEIGNPLGTIRGRAELLLFQAKEANSKRDLEIIIGQIDRIGRLIQSLLRLSRPPAQNAIKSCIIQDVVDTIYQLIRESMNKTKIQFETFFPNEKTQLPIDSDRLTQVLLNLLLNAVHAIQAKIKTTPASEIVLNQKISLHVNDQEKFFEITVSDSGCGISKDNLKNIFKPFFTTKDVGSGTGLGLTLVRQMITEIGGEISLQSEQGKGSTFFIRLKK